MTLTLRQRLAWHATTTLVCLLVTTTEGAAKNCPVTTPVPQGCACGDTVTTSHTLTESDPIVGAPCPRDGLLIGSGVVLNGNGYVIAGDQLHSDDTGIKFIGSGSEVRKLVVRKFQYGVSFENGASNNKLYRVTARKNKRNTETSFYGVRFDQGSHDNLVDLCAIKKNGDEGVHFSGGSHHNALTRSVVSGHADEQVYLVSTSPGNGGPSTNNLIENNLIIGSGGSDNVTLRVDGSSANTIIGNTFKARPVEFVANAADNVFGLTQTPGQSACSELNPCPAQRGTCSRGSCRGNRLVNTVLQFESNCPSPWPKNVPCTGNDAFAAHGNRVVAASIINAKACVTITKSIPGGPIPWDNRVNDSHLDCPTNPDETDREITINDIVANDDLPGPQNLVCNSTCRGATFPACTNTSADVHGELPTVDAVFVQSSACF